MTYFPLYSESLISLKLPSGITACAVKSGAGFATNADMFNS